MKGNVKKVRIAKVQRIYMQNLFILKNKQLYERTPHIVWSSLFLCTFAIRTFFTSPFYNNGINRPPTTVLAWKALSQPVEVK